MILERGSTSKWPLSMVIASWTAVRPSVRDETNWLTASALTSLPYTRTPLATMTVLTVRRPRKAQTNQFDWAMLLNWAKDDNRGSAGPGPVPVTESLSCVAIFKG